ncbi:hypothetical protein AALP_AA8G211400 [Arabis alpina]|uniref:MADS-box domain-containing protein n=1 Tax=Arabis alpina TaxID=50452 RepID=A0A087G8G2_ARAAL|nr:hypothetical protein AALP_AA8G211400 [Arabis alpina]
MVKRGGLKRKIPIEKIDKKTSRAPCYSKRCNGLFGKAAQLCLLSGAQIAVLATPMSDNSNVSFFSFGHASVDDNNSNSYALSAENLDPAVGCFSDDFLQNTNTQMMANSEDFSIMDNNIALQAENFDDLDIMDDIDIMELIDFDSTSESLLPSDEILKTTFESLQSDGVFESTLELQEFAASLLTTSDSHDSMDLTMFSHSQPVQDGDLMLQNRGLSYDYLHFSDVFNELAPIVRL